MFGLSLADELVRVHDAHGDQLDGLESEYRTRARDAVDIDTKSFYGDLLDEIDRLRGLRA